jgi:hypothetical protein
VNDKNSGGKTWMTTLHLKRPFGITLLLAILWVVLFGSLAEGLARTQYVRDNFMSPGLGTAHRQIELQFARLRTRVAEQGPIDCIMLGNSHVWRGFNPAIFEEVYYQATGQTIRCQNFGITGIGAISTGKLAKILVDELHPRLLIYGTSAGDFDSHRAENSASSIFSSPWIRYRLGEKSFDGWLIENSAFYRCYLALNSYLFPINDFMKRSSRETEKNIQPNGFLPFEDTNITYIFDPIENYVIDPEQVDGLQNLFALSSQTTILVVEMPLNNIIYEQFPDLLKQHAEFIAQVSASAEQAGIPFWSTQGLKIIPKRGWKDYHHLGITGANAFSQWLGQRIAEAVLDGGLNLPPRSAP